MVYYTCFLNGEVARLLFDNEIGSVDTLIQLFKHNSYPELQKALCMAIFGASHNNSYIGKRFVEGKALESLLAVMRPNKKPEGPEGTQETKQPHGPQQIVVMYVPPFFFSFFFYQLIFLCLCRLTSMYTISCLAFCNPKAQQFILSENVVDDIMNYLPLPNMRIIPAQLFTVRLALRCLSEMLTPETIREETKEGLVMVSKRAYDS